MVEDVLYRNEDNGYVVFDLDAGGELITAVGELGDIEEGEKLKLEGNYVTHAKFGMQFQAEYCERMLPGTALQIKKYLSSVYQNQMTCASIAARSANALLSFGDIDGFDKIAEAAKNTTASDIRRVFKKYWQDGSRRVFEIEGE